MHMYLVFMGERVWEKGGHMEGRKGYIEHKPGLYQEDFSGANKLESCEKGVTSSRRLMHTTISKKNF